MATERTLGIVKPNAVLDNNIGNILAMYEEAGLRIAAAKFTLLSKEKAEGFYIEHKERPFFHELVDFMISGPILVQIIEAKDAVSFYREIMGSTNPDEAEEGTIRKNYGTNIQCNAVHGSDSIENANIETSFFFSKLEMIK